MWRQDCRLPIHHIPHGYERVLDGAARVVVFAFVDDEDIAGLDGVFDAVDGEYATALNENEHLIDIVDMTRLGMGGFAGFEDIHAAVNHFCIAEFTRHKP